MSRGHVARLESTYLRTQRRINFTGRHRIVRRGRGRRDLVVVLAGHKRHLWDVVMPRLERFLPGDADVCVASPGLVDDELDRRCAANGWSYLSTGPNHPSLALNLAIRAHPEAASVLKIDEDILIGEGFAEGLRDTYDRVEAQGDYRPGFVAPLLNVNGYSYVPFLDALGLRDDYRRRFGPLLHSAGPLPITEDGEAARWVWERTLPFDDVAREFADRPAEHSFVPHKFSIGAIRFSRAFWDHFGGFKVRPFVGGVGVDEAHICAACTTFSRVMVVAHDVLAGHVSFGAQDAVMRRALPELRAGMALDGAPVS